MSLVLLFILLAIILIIYNQHSRNKNNTATGPVVREAQGDQETKRLFLVGGMSCLGMVALLIGILIVIVAIAYVLITGSLIALLVLIRDFFTELSY